MRILAIHNFLDNRRGGAEIAFLNMVVRLKARGHTVDVFVLNISEDFGNKLKENAIKVYNLNFKQWHPFCLNTLAKLFSNIRVAYLFRRFIARYQNNYDLAFVHHFYYSPLALPFFKIPKIYFCQEPPRAYYEPNICTYKRGFTKPLNILIFSLEKLVDRYCVRQADMIIANSDYTREYIYRVYGVLAKTNHPGVDTEEFKKIEDVKKENIVLSIGSLHPMKAHDFVIRSLAKIHKDKRPKLIIAGNGGDKEKLLNLANHFEVELEIRSGLNEQQMVELYNKAILTSAASIMEPFGLSVIESMACQTPVVAIREGGFRETVTEETGILVDRNEEKFAQAMEYLILNPEVAQEMGRKGRKRVEERFGWQRMVDELEKEGKDLERSPEII